MNHPNENTINYENENDFRKLYEQDMEDDTVL